MKQEERLVSAVHGFNATAPDPKFEIELFTYLKNHFSRKALLDLLGRFKVARSDLCAFQRKGKDENEKQSEPLHHPYIGCRRAR